VHHPSTSPVADRGARGRQKVSCRASRNSHHVAQHGCTQIFYLLLVVGGYSAFLFAGLPHLPNDSLGQIHMCATSCCSPPCSPAKLNALMSPLLAPLQLPEPRGSASSASQLHRGVHVVPGRPAPAYVVAADRLHFHALDSLRTTSFASAACDRRDTRVLRQLRVRRRVVPPARMPHVQDHQVSRLVRRYGPR
jgi:hypothetical protein